MEFENTTMLQFDGEELKGRPLSENEAKEKAFYLASQSNIDNAVDVFNKTYDDLTQMGYSDVYQNAEQAYQLESDEKNKLVIANLMGDQSIPRDQKQRMLRQYSLGGFIPKTLKDKYIEDIAVLELGKSTLEMEGQDQIVDSVNTRVNTNNIEAIKENTTFLKTLDEDYAKPISAEAAALVGNLGVGTVKGFFGEFLYKLAGLTVDLLKGNDVDIARYKKEWEEKSNTKLGVDKLQNWFDNLDPKFLAKWMGVEKEFDEAYSTQALNWLGGEFELIAEKTVEKGIAKDKDTALFTMEAIGMMIPFAWKPLKSGYNKLTHPKDSPAVATITANPKLAGDTLATSLDGPDGATLADAMGTTPEAIIAENVLPKHGKKADTGVQYFKYTDEDGNVVYREIEKVIKSKKKGVPDIIRFKKTKGQDMEYMRSADQGEIITLTRQDVALQNGPIPDINRRLKEKEGMTEQAKIIYDSLFDDTIVDSPARFADFERRFNIAQSTKLHHNLPASTFNMGDKFLTGEMVFTQGPDYAFATKAAVEHGIKQLKPLVDAMDSPGTIRVRDLKTNKVYEADAFLKSKAKTLDKGEFQIEYDFKKEYDLLKNPVIQDNRLDSETMSFLGGLNAGGYKTSSISEYFSGTGYFPKWVEMSRKGVGEKAESLLNRVTEKMDNMVKVSTDINPYMGHIARKMEAESIDLYSFSELSNIEVNGVRLGDKLTSKQLERLDALQKEWRTVQDTLFEITNQGEKTRLYAEGFDKGIYINNKPTLMFAKQFNQKTGISLSEVPAEVLDIDTGRIVKYVPDQSKGNIFNAKDPSVNIASGKELIRLNKKQKDVTGASTDYALISAKGKSELKILPQRVINKIPGHYYKQYESHFFIKTKPTYVKHNGIEYGRGTNRAVPDEFIEVKGTATTKYEADLLVKEMSDPNSPNYVPDAVVMSPEKSVANSISDHLAIYKLDTDNYKNALTRAEGVRYLKDDNVIMDPLKALHESSRRITSTAAASQFEKAFTEKFVKDFKDVIPGDSFPRSLDEISATAKGLPASPALEQMVINAKSAWKRHDHFTQAGEVGAFDRAWFNSLQSMADILESRTFKVPAPVLRELASMGISGASTVGKALATRLMITYVLPMRHWIIQPSMFVEQATVFPKTAKATFTKTPLLASELLGFDNSAVKSIVIKDPKAKLEYDLELKALKEANVLETINQNLAAHEVLGRRIRSFDEGTTIAGKLLRPVQTAEGVTAGAFNKYGYGVSELSNLVGMFLQNKERWKAANPGKDWTTKANVQSLAFEAWKQAGAMSRAGALQFQRQPILSFLTQFQAINVKGLVNVLQDNATNLTRGQRAMLAGNRILLHGVKYGTIGGAGKLIYDYFANHDDPEIQANAELLQKGAIDLSIEYLSELIMDEKSDVSISQSASVSATNAPIEVLHGLFQSFAWFMGDRQAQAPNIPFNKAVGRIMESVSKAENIFKYRDVTGDSMFEVMPALLEATSLGSNLAKARRAWRMQDLYTKNGFAKGLEITKTDAFWQALGFSTFKEAELRRGEELKRSSQQRVKDAISDLDGVFVDIFTGSRADAETKFKLLNFEMNLLRQEGNFSGSELNEIYKEVLSRQAARATTTRTGSLFTYLLNSDGRGEDMQSIVNILKNVKKNDPVLQDYYDMIVNRKLSPIKE